MSMIKAGSRVMVRAADGERLERRATTGIEPGYDFPIVWVCKEDEWARARADGREPEAMPWPAADVELADEVTA